MSYFSGLGNKMVIQQVLALYQLNDQSPYNPSKESSHEYYGFSAMSSGASWLIEKVEYTVLVGIKTAATVQQTKQYNIRGINEIEIYVHGGL